MTHEEEKILLWVDMRLAGAPRCVINYFIVKCRSGEVPLVRAKHWFELWQRDHDVSCEWIKQVGPQWENID